MFSKNLKIPNFSFLKKKTLKIQILDSVTAEKCCH